MILIPDRRLYKTTFCMTWRFHTWFIKARDSYREFDKDHIFSRKKILEMVDHGSCRFVDIFELDQSAVSLHPKLAVRSTIVRHNLQHFSPSQSAAPSLWGVSKIHQSINQMIYFGVMYMTFKSRIRNLSYYIIHDNTNFSQVTLLAVLPTITQCNYYYVSTLIAFYKSFITST